MKAREAIKKLRLLPRYLAASEKVQSKMEIVLLNITHLPRSKARLLASKMLRQLMFGALPDGESELSLRLDLMLAHFRARNKRFAEKFAPS